MKIKRFLLVTAALFFVGCQKSLTDYVNPLVGTDGHGHTFPGAILPFGMTQVSPDTRLDGWDGCSGYHYTDDTVYGFSHTHLSGTGCSDYGDLLIMPFTEERNGVAPKTLTYDYYKSHFGHRSEKASPGYYRLLLDRNRVMAELTVHDRNALHRYTFPHSGRKGIVIDLKHRDVVINSGMETRKVGDKTFIVGERVSAAWNPDQHFYFAIAASAPIEEIVYYKEGKATKEKRISGDDCKAMVYFAENSREVTLWVGISAVDIDGACNNLKSSLETSFDNAHNEATAIWEKALSQFEVEGGTKEDVTNFYTALYHCMTSPFLYSDSDGRYRAMKNRRVGAQQEEVMTELQPETTKIEHSEHTIYTVFSVWDTYRALHPLLNLTDAQRSRDFVLTMLDHYRRSGELTMWELASHETHCMIGYHAVSVILDAYRTGVLDDLSEEQLNELLEAMIATSKLPMLGRTEYNRDGFLSSEYENESVSKTLEYAYDDWCIAQLAKELDSIARRNHPDIARNGSIYDEYMRRSQSWKNIVDGNGFMHPRRNGAFLTPFDPTEVNNHFTEANSWQYSSYVPHDVAGWVQMIGGEGNAIEMLDSLFEGNSKMTGREQSDITGLIGQYAHGNEPSHHAAYLYAYLGQQWKTARLVRQICKELYHDTPNGLCGNEDCGQMSAWYVLSAMGFYPVCPGSGEYVLGSPLFNKVTIHLENGNDIVINAENQSHDNCYIQSLKINGEPYNKSFITIEQLKGGCVLDFEMADTPNKAWASNKEGRPGIGMSPTKEITPTPLFDTWQQSFDGEVSVSLYTRGNGETGDSIYYTTDGTTPTRFSKLYTEPFTVWGDANVRAVAYNSRTGYSSVVCHRLTRIQKDLSLTYITKPAPQYYENGETGLIDRLHGSANFRIGGWQGWQEDCELLVDLVNPRVISRVGLECLDNMKAWIFFPSQISVEVSSDGVNYRPFGNIRNEKFPVTLERQEESIMHNFIVNGAPIWTRYVRIKALNYGKLPSWHISAGEQAWLFVDEITID